jgi:DNA-binding NarL/FixJ family response regulator
MPSYRIMIVDDHPMMLEALQLGIANEEDFVFAGSAANGIDAIDMAKEIKPDLIIMDLFLPGMNGIAAMQKIQESMPGAVVLFLSSSFDEEDILAAVAAGAKGYLQKSQPRAAIMHAIREVARGRKYFPPEIAGKLADAVYHHQNRLSMLTARETEVLSLLGEGLTYDRLAQRLSVSESTIRVHIHNMCSKLGLQNRTELIIYAMKQKN